MDGGALDESVSIELAKEQKSKPKRVAGDDDLNFLLKMRGIELRYILLTIHIPSCSTWPRCGAWRTIMMIETLHPFIGIARIVVSYPSSLFFQSSLMDCPRLFFRFD